MAKKNTKETGISGEREAERFLKKAGFRVLAKNYRTPAGEIDIIARKGDDLIFVEVKSRRSKEFGYPGEAVGPHKQRKIIKTAMWYVQEKRLHHMNMRFDVISILFDSRGSFVIDHVPGAFDATGWV